jgi:hypothetical protein
MVTEKEFFSGLKKILKQTYATKRTQFSTNLNSHSAFWLIYDNETLLYLDLFSLYVGYDV